MWQSLGWVHFRDPRGGRSKKKESEQNIMACQLPCIHMRGHAYAWVAIITSTLHCYSVQQLLADRIFSPRYWNNCCSVGIWLKYHLWHCLSCVTETVRQCSNNLTNSYKEKQGYAARNLDQLRAIHLTYECGTTVYLRFYLTITRSRAVELCDLLPCQATSRVIYLHRQAACWLPLSVTIRPKVGVHHATTHAINSHITPNGSMNL